LTVCLSGSTSSSLVIPSNTLWYGTYRINVTASLSNGLSGSSLLPATLDASAPATTYLTVYPTPLNASIVVVGDTNDFSANDTVTLDLTASGDRDVVRGNATGMHLYLFCYSQNATATYDGLSLSQLLALASSLGNNR
jgi:hypothetical protein